MNQNNKVPEGDAYEKRIITLIAATNQTAHSPSNEAITYWAGGGAANEQNY